MRRASTLNNIAALSLLMIIPFAAAAQNERS